MALCINIINVMYQEFICICSLLSNIVQLLQKKAKLRSREYFSNLRPRKQGKICRNKKNLVLRIGIAYSI